MPKWTLIVTSAIMHNRVRLFPRDFALSMDRDSDGPYLRVMNIESDFYIKAIRNNRTKRVVELPKTNRVERSVHYVDVREGIIESDFRIEVEL